MDSPYLIFYLMIYFISDNNLLFPTIKASIKIYLKKYPQINNVMLPSLSFNTLELSRQIVYKSKINVIP